MDDVKKTVLSRQSGAGGHVNSQTVIACQDHISSSQTESQLGAGEVGTESHAS